MKTIYGDVDEGKLIEQQKLLDQLAPEKEPITQEAWDEHRVGNAYFAIAGNTFITSGPNDDYTPTDYVGKSSGRRGMDPDPHRQGYKLHVSAHPHHVGAVTAAVLPALQGDPAVWHKLSRLDAYCKDKEEQRGKFITIYTKDPQHLQEVALKVQKALHDAGIDPHTQGGGLCAGDLKTGPSDLLCVRYGAFGGTNSDKVYVDRMSHEDKREIPCPRAYQERFDQETGPLVEALNHQWQQLEQQKMGVTTTTTSEQLPKRQSTRDSLEMEKHDHESSHSNSNITIEDVGEDKAVEVGDNTTDEKEKVEQHQHVGSTGEALAQRSQRSGNRNAVNYSSGSKDKRKAVYLGKGGNG